MNTRCGYECSCPVTLPLEDEIRGLEEHKKILIGQLEATDKKISTLKSLRES
ncbi:hypothetical protein [uncultured Methanoregula sp.]|uniref:hypothetical protein n=1 Tax=uncultured Methanoregula sp. TaxID=1005933 RepID=UPI002AAACFD8|nr:hypothetical protein [uncultured Methanoregula sp.]